MTHSLFAVHIADGVLSWPWLAAGFALAGLLAALACWRLREDEVPRVALMSAAFFVASSIHVKLGPSSVHLLLNGLVGVVLGWRAPLAILLGVTLQALLIPHGGLTTIGVNACTEALPALLAGALFGPLLQVCRSPRPWARALLVGASALLWGGCLVFGVAALWTGGLSGLVQVSASAGVVFSTEGLEPALAFCTHPVTIAGLVAFAVLCALIHPYWSARPEVPAGVFVGVLSVVLTLVLTGGVLLLDGAETWGRFVSAVFVVHLPLALIEGLILGATVGFLARVKPEMLRLPEPALPRETVLAVIAVLGLLLTASPAQAHRLKADRRIDVAKRTVTIDSFYFETGKPPLMATVKVLRDDDSVLAKGPLDASGKFVFTYEKAERLRVEIDAEGGHHTEVVLTARELGGEDAAAERPRGEEGGSRWRDLFVGLTFLLALGAFILSWLTAQRVTRALQSSYNGGKQEERSVSTQTISISAASLRMLQELAAQTGQTPVEVLDRALDAYQRKVFIEGVNAGYAALRADPAAWAEVEAERESMRGSQMDGLDPKEAWGEDGWPLPRGESQNNG